MSLIRDWPVHMVIIPVGSVGRVRVRLIAHVPFAGVLGVAIWIRVLAVLGYPAPLWFGDSKSYLEAASSCGRVRRVRVDTRFCSG